MAPQSVLKTVNLTQLKFACSSCSLQELCLPVGLSGKEITYLEDLVSRKRQIKRGEHLYRAGMPFEALFIVRNGFFKTYVLYEDGREQVTGFQMMGEIMGLDAISADAHTCHAMSLEDSDLCEVPFDKLEALSRQVPALQHHFHKMMSREIVRDQGLMLLLGNMSAEERLVTFLLNLSQRFGARGYSRTEFVLRMTREEIGNYLGLKLETVSRTFSKLQDEGLIQVQHRAIHILDPKRLNGLLGEARRP